MRIELVVGSLPLLLAAAVPVSAQQQGYGGYDSAGYGAETLDERVAKLEKRLSGPGLAELGQQIERLQREVAKLRGQFEELDHKLENLKLQQQSLYTDLEQRIQQSTGAAGAVTEAPGTAGSDTVAGSESTSPAEAPETQAPAPPPSRATGSASDGQAAREVAYQKAFTTLKEGRYTDAVKEFKNFTARYPSGDYADNAQYWLGEAYYVNRDFTAAREAFQKLIEKFPQSPKVPDAYLKLAYIEYDTGKTANAKQLLNDVIKRYPGSTASKQAEKRLQKLQQPK